MTRGEVTLGGRRVAFSGATLDSRAVKPGMLFVALPGEKVDGRAFIPQALAAGAAGIVEGLDELERVAREYRASLRAKVVGVTGSAGKTTTKEFLKAFLSQGGKTHATAGNYNNGIGLPLTILNCPPDADFLVLEMGTNHPGEIAHLVSIGRPNAGVISSIGTAHIEFFKSLDGTAAEKGMLFSALEPAADGTRFAVVGRNNDRFDKLVSLVASGAETVAVDPASDPRAARLASALAETLPGAHNVSNALLAAAAAEKWGVPFEACLSALKDFRLPGHRWETTERGGVIFVNDAYNANPASMTAALETFAARPCKGRRIVVLGDMFELGERSAELHHAVKEKVSALGFDRALYAGDAFGGGTVEEVRTALFAYVRPGDAVLLKGSRGMALEKILA